MELWTLRDPEDWNPTEQLLNISQAIPSKQITPETTISQIHSDLSSPADYYQHEEQLDLTLTPHQNLQEGRVHVLPGHIREPWVHSHHSLDPTWNSDLLKDAKFVHRVEEVIKDLGDFPPNQQQLQLDMARLIVRGERYQKHNSFFSRMKMYFARNK